MNLIFNLKFRVLRDGDRVTLDYWRNRINLLVDENGLVKCSYAA